MHACNLNPFSQNLLHQLHLSLATRGKLIFMRVPETLELAHILVMNAGDVFGGRIGALDDHDGAADDNVEGTAVGQEADVVVEDAAGVEERDGEAEDALEEELQAVDARVGARGELVVEFILAKGEHGHEIGARADGQLDKAETSAQYETHRVWLGVERLGCPANDNGNGASHAFL